MSLWGLCGHFLSTPCTPWLSNGAGLERLWDGAGKRWRRGVRAHSLLVGGSLGADDGQSVLCI